MLEATSATRTRTSAHAGGVEHAARRLVAPQEEEDRQHADEAAHSGKQRPLAGDERRRPADGDDEAEGGRNRLARHDQHPHERREAEDRQQDERVHQLEVDAVERELGLVEVEEALADAVQDRAEEVALRVPRPGVRERDLVRGARREERRAGQHREDRQA